MEKDVQRKFPDKCAVTTGNATVTTSCHCELTLALRAIESGSTAIPIKIGVSKSICWLCEQYLEFLTNNQNVRFLVSQYQGKIHAGWRIPRNTPEAVKRKLYLLVNEEVREIRESIINRRKSDFFPPEDREGLENVLRKSYIVDCLEWTL